MTTPLTSHPTAFRPGNRRWPAGDGFYAEIFNVLDRASLVVADLTGMRTNCLMELGYALGRRRRFVISAHEGTHLGFDHDKLPTYFWCEWERPRRTSTTTGAAGTPASSFGSPSGRVHSMSDCGAAVRRHRTTPTMESRQGVRRIGLRFLPCRLTRAPSS
jgi:hypothetical protein